MTTRGDLREGADLVMERYQTPKGMVPGRFRFALVGFAFARILIDVADRAAYLECSRNYRHSFRCIYSWDLRRRRIFRLPARTDMRSLRPNLLARVPCGQRLHD